MLKTIPRICLSSQLIIPDAWNILQATNPFYPPPGIQRHGTSPRKMMKHGGFNRKMTGFRFVIGVIFQSSSIDPWHGLGFSYEINHPAMGYPPWLWNPPVIITSIAATHQTDSAPVISGMPWRWGDGRPPRVFAINRTGLFQGKIYRKPWFLHVFTMRDGVSCKCSRKSTQWIWILIPYGFNSLVRTYLEIIPRGDILSKGLDPEIVFYMTGMGFILKLGRQNPRI